MSTNKFILNGEVKIDLSQDTVTEDDVTKGKTFHKADGSQAVGTGGIVAALNIAYGDIPPEDTSKLWVKTSEPNGVTVSPNKVFTEGGQDEALSEYQISALKYYGGAMAAVGNDIYIFGGRTVSNSAAQTVIQRFTVETGTVTTLSAKVPNGALRIACAAYGTKIYLFGGTASDSAAAANVRNYIYEFDTVSLEIKTLDAMFRVGVGRACAATVGSKIYVFGGRTSDWDGARSAISIFDAETLTFSDSNGGDLPTANYYMSCAPVGTKVYLFGGTKVMESIVCYDTETEKATELSVKLPAPRSTIGCSAINDMIVLIGGNSNAAPETHGVTHDIWYFDTKTNEITTSKFVTNGDLTETYAVTIGNTVYAMSGGYGWVYEYDPPIGHMLLDKDRLQILSSPGENPFMVINHNSVKAEIGVSEVYKGNELGYGERTEASLYKDGDWITI